MRLHVISTSWDS